MKKDIRLIIFIQTEKGARQVAITPTTKNLVLNIISDENGVVKVLDEESPFEFAGETLYYNQI